MQTIPIFDPHPQHDALPGAMQGAFARILSQGSFILGGEVTSFERGCAEWLRTSHAVGVSSGSDALFLALRALGIGPGDEVITSAFTFVATAEAILRVGATPVFADIDPTHFGLDPARTERLVTPKTRAVLYVHLYGQLGSIAEHAELCRRLGLFLVEDACQAFGARLDGKAAGTWGDIGCHSFFPTKPLGGLGDGGLCVTDSSKLAELLRRLRSHGFSNDGRAEALGGNFRLDALQAALLSEKLPHVEAWRIAREHIALTYCAAFQHCRSFRTLLPPAGANVPAWSVYTLRVRDGREHLRQWLASVGVEARCYYASHLAEHAAIAPHCRRDELTQTIQASQRVLSIPLYFGLPEVAQQRIIQAVLEWDDSTARRR